MRSVHVVSGLARKNGGPAYSVPRLRHALTTAGCDAKLLTITEDAGEPARPDAEVFPPAFRSTPILSSLRVSPALRHALMRRAQLTDIIHNHGLWLMPNVDAAGIASKCAKPLIVSPRGMLAPEALRFSTLKKRLFWALLQGPAVAGAAAWHATSATEAEDIRAYGINAPIAVIPNGIDLSENVALHQIDAKRRTLLFMSRLHPKKGLPNLIAAWSDVSSKRPDWDLVVAGPDEGGHEAELRRQVAANNVRSVHFLGPVYGERKDALLASADLFVLPTKTENFGISIAEALGAGVPSIVTKGAPWVGLEVEQCGWWIDHGIEPLVSTLLQATALTPNERHDMGLRGRAWMERDFGWGPLAEKMIAVYRWVAGQGARPDTVHL